jgi:hypothetical protein
MTEAGRIPHGANPVYSSFMAGVDFVVRGAEDEVLATVREAARAEQFDVAMEPDGLLAVRRGSFALSIVLGAFIAYCDFKFMLEPAVGDTVRLSLVRNNPWWTGLIGISRVKKAAARLADAVHRALGPRVVSRTDV